MNYVNASKEPVSYKTILRMIVGTNMLFVDQIPILSNIKQNCLLAILTSNSIK